MQFDSDRTEALFEAVPEPVVLVEFCDGEPIVRACNDTFTRQFGYAAESIVGESLNEYILPDDDHARQAATEIDEAAAEGRTIERSLTRQTADGTRDFLFRAAPFEEEDTVKSLGIYIDITDRHREQRRYEALIEHSSDIITILEVDGTIRYESPSVERILGYEPAQLVGESAFDYIHPDDRERVIEEFERSLRNEDLQPEVEYRFTAADGSWRWLASTGSNHIDSKPIEGYVVNSRDITERKQREQELQRQNERLDEFASVVSHDLRNPLQIAQGRATILEDLCGAESEEHLVALVNALERMESIVQDTLTLARQGETVIEMTAIPFGELVEDCWAGVETAEATLEVDDGFTIRGDRGRLRQVFENLFRNAVEHGGDDVTVRVGRAGEGCVYVEDDGPGIPVNERDEVFGAGHTTETEGTGFGLAIVKRIAEAHGWEVSVTDGRDGGARFRFDNVELSSG